MTQLYIANIGSYPRIGEEKDQQRHRRALHHLQNKELSSHAYHDVEQSVIQEIVREQILGGLDEVTDGGVSRHDPISYFCRKVGGIKLMGLARYFDTNTYFRVPVFTGKPRKKSSAVLADFNFAQSISNKPIRCVLTGPYTLARLSGSTTSTFKRVQARHAFFTSLITSEIKTLVQQGARFIQIDEPAIGHHPEDIVLFQKSTETLREAARPARFILALYFSPLSTLYPHFRQLPVDVLNLDFTYDGKKLLEKVTDHPPSMALGFGFLNSRNTRLEPIDPIIRILKSWADQQNPSYFYLTASSGLDTLPRPVAFEKIKILSKIKGEVDEYLNMK